MKKAKVTLSVAGRPTTYVVMYESFESLSEEVWKFSFNPHYEYDKTIVTLDDGNSYRWSDWYAHYCFAKSRLSVSDFIDVQFTKDQAA